MQARTCFHSFAMSTYHVLIELHQKLEFVHMDVRLPNICFSGAR